MSIFPRGRQASTCCVFISFNASFISIFVFISLPPPPLSPQKTSSWTPILHSSRMNHHTVEVVFCTIMPYTVKSSVFRPSVDAPRRRSCFDLAAGSFRAMTTCLFTRSSRVGTASPSLRRRKNESFLSSTAAASSASENRLNPARRSTRPSGRFTPQWNVSSGGERENYPEAVR